VTLVALALAPEARAKSYEQSRQLCFEGDRDRQRIVQACDTVIRANREPTESLALAHLSRGMSLRRLGQPDRALHDYGTAIRLKPDYSNAYNSRCYLHAILNRLQEAIKDCNEAVRLDPNNQYAYDSRAFSYLKLGMFDASIADYNVALRLEPDRPYSLFGRGVARYRKGDRNGGNADMAAAKAKIATIAEEFAQYGVKPD
jgi:tetratricopeptide (TPR) repeat protein